MAISDVGMNNGGAEARSRLVSVVIPAYNAGNYLRDCLESVFRQTWRQRDVIVVDDGSTDQTPRVAQSYSGRIRYLHIENGGPARARNEGIRMATGAYIAFLDADDIWVETKLERQIEFMERESDVVLCFTDGTLFDERGEDAASFLGGKKVLPGLATAAKNGGRRFLTKVHESLLYENFILTSSVLLRAGRWPREDWFLKTVQFDEQLFNGQDFDLWFRIAAERNCGYLPEVLVKKRRHADNISQRGETVMLNRIRMRGKVYDLVRERSDVSGRAKARTKERFLLSYVDLARWYLLQGRESEAREICRQAFRFGFHRGLLVPWFLSRAGRRVSRWLLKNHQTAKAIK